MSSAYIQEDEYITAKEFSYLTSNHHELLMAPIRTKVLQKIRSGEVPCLIWEGRKSLATLVYNNLSSSLNRSDTQIFVVRLSKRERSDLFVVELILNETLE